MDFCNATHTAGVVILFLETIKTSKMQMHASISMHNLANIDKQRQNSAGREACSEHQGGYLYMNVNTCALPTKKKTITPCH